MESAKPETSAKPVDAEQTVPNRIMELIAKHLSDRDAETRELQEKTVLQISEALIKHIPQILSFGLGPVGVFAGVTDPNEDASPMLKDMREAAAAFKHAFTDRVAPSEMDALKALLGTLTSEILKNASDLSFVSSK